MCGSPRTLACCLITLLCVMVGSILNAQTPVQRKKRALNAIEREAYRDALQDLEVYLPLYPDDHHMLPSYGLSLYHMAQPDSAYIVLKEAWKLLEDDMPPEAAFTLARLEAINDEPMNAVAAYKRAMALRAMTDDQAQRAALGIMHARSALTSEPPDPTIQVELVPQETSSPMHHMYPAYQVDGSLAWVSIARGTAAPHSAEDIQLMCASADSFITYHPNDDLSYLSIRASRDGSQWWTISHDKSIVLARLPIQSDQIDTVADMAPPYYPELGDRSWTQVGQATYLFASLRPGGFGGYDLYETRLVDDRWTAPHNLGAQVNTAFNEIDPNIISAGAELVYSSDRPSSYGGYDLYVSPYQVATQSWMKGAHLPIPINSAADEGGYSQGIDGQEFFHSDRQPTRSYGIYKVTGRHVRVPPSSIDADTTSIVSVTPSPELDEEQRLQEAIDSILTAPRDKPLTLPVGAEIGDLPPLHYGRKSPHIHPHMQTTLDLAIKHIEAHHPLSIVLVVHAPHQLDAKHQDLPDRVANRIVDYLTQRTQLRDDDIYILNVDNQVPFLSDDADEVMTGMDRVLNQRIDIRLVRMQTPYLATSPYVTGLNKPSWHPRHIALHERCEGISYMVAVERPLEGAADAYFILKHKQGAEVSYRYWVEDIEQLLRLYAWLGRPSPDDLFACYQGRTLSVEEVDQMKYYFPELQQFEALRMLFEK